MWSYLLAAVKAQNLSAIKEKKNKFPSINNGWQAELFLNHLEVSASPVKV